MKELNVIIKSSIHNLADYRQMFDLNERDLEKKLLDYPAGISSVNVELSALGYTIISADPIFNLDFKQMKELARDILFKNIAEADPSRDKMIIENWKQTIELFLQDYEAGKQQGRYIPMELPPVSAITGPIELLLCKDLLVNPDIATEFDTTQLVASLAQMSAEMRIFPLPEDKNAVNSALGPIMLEFQRRNFGVEVRAIQYPQRGDYNAMLRIWAKECVVSQ